VSKVKPEQADAILCFSILVMILTFCLDINGPEEKDALTDIINLLHMLQSPSGVLDAVRQNLNATKVGVLLRHTWKAQPHAIPPDVHASLEVLQDLALATSDPGDVSELFTAIAKLRRFFTLTEPHPTSVKHMLSWPISPGREFSALLEQRNGVAMCILAHWGVPLYNAPPTWYVSNWPKKLMLGLAEQLPGLQWSEAMSWPLEETLGSGPTLAGLELTLPSEPSDRGDSESFPVS
jgi:hypothetical protein